MSVSLTKGGNISLEKVAPGMTHACVGLGWDPRTTDGAPFDLDASAVLLGVDGKAVSAQIHRSAAVRVGLSCAREPRVWPLICENGYLWHGLVRGEALSPCG
ncbi:TerD family protein [Xylanimonas protaetiae]|uniref:TerD domain-containing protein n=1 Tax=Xylanimonas protaetiae TaxID=2509457 RepID=A0A4P6F549_9MICO|nr:TerD family protein [Xylanimonas protaetiae]QAY70734.1 hypothetical protein ET471_12470 [Xylanimonas protaetiae]